MTLPVESSLSIIQFVGENSNNNKEFIKERLNILSPTY
jgi:hypothetical protein